MITGQKALIKEISPEVKIYETNWSDESTTYGVEFNGVGGGIQYLNYMEAFQEAIKGGLK